MAKQKDTQKIEELEELLEWWRSRKGDTTTNIQKQSTRRNVYLPDDLWEALKVRAEFELRSISDLVREALRAYLEAK